METAHGERAVRHGSYVTDDYGRASLYLTEMFFRMSHGSSLVRLFLYKKAVYSSAHASTDILL